MRIERRQTYKGGAYRLIVYPERKEEEELLLRGVEFRVEVWVERREVEGEPGTKMTTGIMCATQNCPLVREWERASAETPIVRSR